MFFRTVTRDDRREYEFFAPGSGGFIRADVGPGGDMVQICRGGGTTGVTLSATSEEHLKAKARNWLRQHRSWM